MTTKTLQRILLIGTTFLFLSFDLPIPQGWVKAGSKPNSYEIGIDKAAGQDGKNAATIKSIYKKIKGSGSLYQDCLPNKYLGKRVRLSGYVKAKEVADCAGLWMRVDQANSKYSLSLDDMFDRPIKGTADWKKYDIVLDIPLNASNIAYGGYLSGTGQIWFDNLTFEVVDNSVQTTDKSKNYMPRTEPTNLNFDN